MRSRLEFEALACLGLMLTVLAAALTAPKAFTGGLVMLFIGCLLFGCGWVAASRTRPPDPPTNIMQCWFWKVETLPALPRTIVSYLLRILGLVLMCLAVVWMVEGPFPSVARLAGPIGALITVTFVVVLLLRQYLGDK